MDSSAEPGGERVPFTADEHMAEMINDRLYRGERTKDSALVTVHDTPGEFRTLEAPEGGFDWGRRTPGAEALARALIGDAVGADDGVLVERFLSEVLAALSFVEPWLLWRSEIQAWAAKAQ